MTQKWKHVCVQVVSWMTSATKDMQASGGDQKQKRFKDPPRKAEARQTGGTVAHSVNVALRCPQTACRRHKWIDGTKTMTWCCFEAAHSRIIRHCGQRGGFVGCGENLFNPFSLPVDKFCPK